LLAQEHQMTVFKDISGWREELEELRNSPVYQAMYPKTHGLPRKDPLIPLSAILDFTETLLLNAETREAVIIRDKWYEDNPLGDRTHYDINELDTDPTYPHDKSQLLYSDFPLWYILKTGFGPTTHSYFNGIDLALQILQEKIPNVRSEQARQYLKDRTRFTSSIDGKTKYSIDHSK
jgi:hypothetical protein